MYELRALLYSMRLLDRLYAENISEENLVKTLPQEFNY